MENNTPFPISPLKKTPSAALAYQNQQETLPDTSLAVNLTSWAYEQDKSNHCLKNVFNTSNLKFIPNYSGVDHATARQHH